MSRFMRAMLLAFAGAAIAATAAGQGVYDYNSQYMMRKLGRLPPAVEKISDAQDGAAAFRAEPATPDNAYRLTYFYRKFGRFEPHQQQVVDAYRASAAYREEVVVPSVANSGTYSERYVWRKFGRLP